MLVESMSPTHHITTTLLLISFTHGWGKGPPSYYCFIIATPSRKIKYYYFCSHSAYLTIQCNIIVAIFTSQRFLLSYFTWHLNIFTTYFKFTRLGQLLPFLHQVYRAVKEPWPCRLYIHFFTTFFFFKYIHTPTFSSNNIVKSNALY